MFLLKYPYICIDNNKHLKLILIIKKQTFVGALIATAQFLWCLHGKGYF